MASLIVPDADLLLYAFDDMSRDCVASRDWWERSLNSAQVRIPLQSILAFIRLTTSRKVPGARFTLVDALKIVDSWMVRPNVSLLLPGPSHWKIFRQLSAEADASGPLSTDAHLAALAIEHNAIVYSADLDFARFPGLRWVNPVVANV